VVRHSHPQVRPLAITAPPTLASIHIIISCKGYIRSDTIIAKRSANGSRCSGMRSTKVVQSKACWNEAGALRKWHLLHSAGAKSSTYAPAGTCARLSVLRIAACGTAVPP